MNIYKTILFALIFISTTAFSQIPSGYYDDADGLTGTTLRQALHDIIDNHNSQSYSSLWYHLEDTDKKSNGKVWDMYSDVPGGTPPYEFTFGSDQCGNYQNEGDCYNREHSWPKSWFNDGYPMYTDLFHLVPTDGYVNGQRSNYPYGETRDPFWESMNGSKVGQSSFSNMNGTVFEPIDAYKGDFARNYFYMVTRYYNEDNGWDSNELVDGANLTNVGLALLKKWHEQDPVSQKEIDRNNAVYDIQNNRNPFIDHPEYVDDIWGNINTPPYFENFIENFTMVEGETENYTINFNDDDLNTVSFDIECIFCNADFISFTEPTSGTVNIEFSPDFNDAGLYSLAAILEDGTNDEVNFSFQLTVEEGNGIVNSENYFNVFPNPAESSFTISTTEALSTKTNAKVYDISGQCIETISIHKTQRITFGQNFAPGTYILKVTDHKHTFIEKLIKQ